MDGVAAGCESGGLTPSDGPLVPQTVRQVPGIRGEGKGWAREGGGGLREPWSFRAQGACTQSAPHALALSCKVGGRDKTKR